MVRLRSPLLVVLLMMTGCASFRKGTPTAAWKNLAPDRLADLTINFRQIGERDYVLWRSPDRAYFLEGYVSGMMTDYQDNPIAGVVVSASLEAEDLLNKVLGANRKEGVASPTFDPGISNSQGIYRIRFSLPIRGGLVDVRGRLIYNPQWEQERARLGKAYEPQRRESSFRLYYDQESGLVAFSEGLQRVIVQPVFSAPSKNALPGAKAPAGAEAVPKAGNISPDDLLQGISFP